MLPQAPTEPQNNASPEAAALPRIIQGGMGVAVSDWRLARAVALAGELGVVSGTGIDNVLVRRLQDGDPGRHVRRALAHYPLPEKAADIVRRFYIEGGKAPGAAYKRVPLPSLKNHRATFELGIAGAFVEVWLAKEGHSGRVGVNLLTKLQLPTLPALYGAMLAGVDVVIMGAGIPREIPVILDRFAAGEAATIRIDVKGAAPGDAASVTLDPADYGLPRARLPRPDFYPIVSSHVLAGMLLKKSGGSIEGFVIEGHTAGGHNAPPRGQVQYDDQGQPVYGERDVCDLSEMRALGLPFWLAGSYGTPQRLQEALSEGAAGVQIGTLFAYCAEAGFRDDMQREVLERLSRGTVSVYTDPLASPTGFPFKVVQLEQTLANPEVYAARTRVCDIGYLREAYADEGGKVGWRCSAEPVETYLAKGGKLEDTVGRKCLCNALMADAGFAQVQKGGEVEQPLLTSGDSVASLGGWTPGYCAADVVAYLRGEAGKV